MDEEIGLRLSLKGRRETAAGIDDVGDKLDRAGDEAAAVGRKARIGAAGMVSMGRSGRLAGRAIVYGMGAAGAAVVGAGIVLTQLAKDSVAEAREAQKVGAVTRAEIKATGGVANVTARSMGRLTGAISAKVGIDDEAIQSGANLLLTFKNVRNEVGRGNDIFNQATQAAVDLSAAGYGSITSQSKMLGKALNDPIKGMAAMNKAGVTFSAEQQERIKGFVEENRLLDAQKIILGEVESQVGGVAAEQATWGEKASVTIGNIKERIGTALLPMLDRVQRWFVQDGGPAIDKYVGIFERRGIPVIEKYANLFVDRGIPAIKNFLDEARPLAESVLPAIGSALGTTRDVVRELAPKLKTVFDAFNDLPDWAKQAIIIGAGGAAVAKKLGADNLLGSVVSMAKPMPVFVTNPGFGPGGLPGKTPSGVPPVVPTGPGGKPGLPAMPGAIGTSIWGAILPALGFGLVNSDPKNVHPGTGNELTSVGGYDLSSPAKVEEYAKYREELERTSELFKTLPTELQTDIVLHGAPESRREAIQLAKTYDLTKEQRTTLFRTSGVPLSNKQVADLIHLYDNARKPIVTPVVVTGVQSALNQIQMVTNAASNVVGGFFGRNPEGRATGGPVKAGTPYIVGERRAELFVPKVDGMVLPRVPDLADLEEFDPGNFPAIPIEVHSYTYLDGKLVAESTVSHLQTKAARK